MKRAYLPVLVGRHHEQLPVLCNLMGDKALQPRIHTIVAHIQGAGRETRRFRIFFKIHCRMAVNDKVANVRGDVLVARLGEDDDSNHVINLRSGDGLFVRRALDL